MNRNPREHQRSFAIKLHPKNYSLFDGVVLDFKNQKLQGVKDGKLFPLLGGATLEYSRSRAKGGKKILHNSISPRDEVWFNSNRQLLDYDHLVAVDTNTKQIGGSSVSITAAYHLVPKWHSAEQAFCQGAVIALLEMWNVIGKPENMGWWQILQAIKKSSQDYSGRIGLIVDSDLENHEKFNSREIPILHDFFLPDNVNIIYASDRGGAEHLSTRMIKYCHDLASDLYKEESLLMNVKNLHKGVDGLYSHFRQWDTESRGLRLPFPVR